MPMHAYRSFHPVKLISFDLDDTLYDNRAVIRNAEAAFVRKINQIGGLAQPLTHDKWQHWKQQTFATNPILYEDVTRWRQDALRHLLQYHGKNTAEIDRTLAHCMDEFLLWRHKIDVPPPHIDVLQQLKPHYTLTVITNGNVDPKLIGLTLFDLVLRGGEQGRAKPHADLFRQTAEHFNLTPQEILHVGDNLITDVQGAIQAGCQAAWLNQTTQALRHAHDARLLPTLELTNITDLLSLIPKVKTDRTLTFHQKKNRVRKHGLTEPNSIRRISVGRIP